MSTELHLKYRPTSLTEILGQDHIVTSLESVLKKGTARSFLFTGPSGCGKTTLARIIATEVGCTPANIIEIDAATRTGVDNVRDLIELTQYVPIGGKSNRMIIMDECHMLSKGAWNALLKVVEEPPKGVYWCLITTEEGKVPKTIRTRCTKYDVQEVDEEILMALICDTADEEKLDTPDEILELCGTAAQGSPRAALVALATVADCTDIKQARLLLRDVGESSKEVIELSRALMKGCTYQQAAKLVGAMGKIHAEGARHQICGYFTKVALSGNTRALAVLSAFGEPYPPTTMVYPLLLSLGELLLNDD